MIMHQFLQYEQGMRRGKRKEASVMLRIQSILARNVAVRTASITRFDLLLPARAGDVLEPGDIAAPATIAPVVFVVVLLKAFCAKTQSIPPLMCAWKVASCQISIV